MNDRLRALSKIDSLLYQIDTILKCQFPYKSSENALQKIKKHFSSFRVFIAEASDKNKVLPELCLQISEDIVRYLPIIGLLSNSANVRNIFEFHEPFWRLSSYILCHDNPPRLADINLVISSEWNFSPFVVARAELKNFILIGMPALESKNPLLFPLAGHELGHVVWTQNLKKRDILAKAKIYLFDRLAPPSTTNAIDFLKSEENFKIYKIVESYIIELFCDCFGLRLFRESYIYAFYYLLLPLRSFSGTMHPSLRYRGEILKKASAKFKFDFPTGFNNEKKDEKSGDEKLAILYSTCDYVIDDIFELVNEIIKDSMRHAKTTYDFAGEKTEQIKIKNSLMKVIPATEIKSLSDIINAGWIIYNKLHEAEEVIPTNDAEEIMPKITMDMLFDLVSKSFEVLAIEARLA